MQKTIKHLASAIVVALFLFIALASGDTSGSSYGVKSAAEDEYKCGECRTIRKDASGCFSKMGGRCSWVSHTDKAFGGNYFYCSRVCCEK